MPENDHASLHDWIQNEAVAFSLESTESLNAVVDKIIAGAGEIDLLGLGEPTHGCAVFPLLRNAIFQRLADEHGYSAIAIESGYSRCDIVDDYVNGGAGTIDDVLETGITHTMGKMPGARELIEWMRTYNAKRSHTTKLSFYGFDAPTEMTHSDSPRRQLHAALDYLQPIDGDAVTTWREKIDALIGDDAAWESREANYDPSKSIGNSDAAKSLRTEVEELVHLFEVRSAELISKTNDRAFIAAQMQAVGARMLLDYHAAVATPSDDRPAKLLGIRDQIMATNLEYISLRERGRGKVFVFAHNSHLQRGKASWQWGPNLLEWWAAGAHVASLFDQRYFVIGTGIGESTTLKLPPPEAGTLEQLFCAAEGPMRFVPTHQGEGLPHAEIANTPLRNNPNPAYFPLTHESLRQFDGLIVVNEE